MRPWCGAGRARQCCNLPPPVLHYYCLALCAIPTRRAKKPKKAAEAPVGGKPADLEAAAELAQGAGAGEAEQQQQEAQQEAEQEAEEQCQQLRAGSEGVSAEASPHAHAAAVAAEEDGISAGDGALDVAEYELGEDEWEGTPATPLGEGEEDEATAALQVGWLAGGELWACVTAAPGRWFDRHACVCVAFLLTMPPDSMLPALPTWAPCRPRCSS